MRSPACDERGGSETPSQLALTGGRYETPPGRRSLLARILPSWAFYPRFLWIVWKAGRLAKRSRYGYREWSHSSFEVLEALEKAGVRFKISGVDRLEQLGEPFVVVANHMSTLETAILPSIIQPVHDVTFVVKESLLHYPVFKYVMRSRDPVAVTQTNAREDLKRMLVEGSDRINRGISLVVFPEGRRGSEFELARFNTIGVKIAQRTGAPMVPLALRTDAWSIGKHIPELGKIVPERTVHFEFGEPMRVQGRGAEEHQRCIDFIEAKLGQWRLEDQGER